MSDTITRDEDVAAEALRFPNVHIAVFNGHTMTENVRPVRLRLSRAKGFDLQAHSRAINGLPAVNCARPSVYGNDFTVADYGTAENAVAMFEHDLLKFSCFHPEEYERLLQRLAGKNLACWCTLKACCHVDIWLRVAAPCRCDNPVGPEK